MSKQRIDKILSSQNNFSRSQIKLMIKSGRITVNGNIIKRAEEKFEAEESEIMIDGKTISYKKYIYIMMNKPAGILSAARDKHSKTVLDLVPNEMKRKGLFPAGRLDKDTIGFILITDDGEMAHKMLSPKNHVYKLYEAETDRPLNADDIKKFKSGIDFGEEKFLPAELKIIDERKAYVEICEGKFHQVKKMFKAVDAEVVKLKRLRIGSLFLDPNLQEGECRELTKEELKMIFNKKI